MKAVLTLDDDFRAMIAAEVKKATIEALSEVQVEKIGPYLELKEVYRVLGISESTFKKHFREKGLPIIEIGTRRVVALKDLEVFLEELKMYAFA